eukprot:363267-Chlamydomonas_euryale.AAC.21
MHASPLSWRCSSAAVPQGLTQRPCTRQRAPVDRGLFAIKEPCRDGDFDRLQDGVRDGASSGPSTGIAPAAASSPSSCTLSLRSACLRAGSGCSAACPCCACACAHAYTRACVCLRVHAFVQMRRHAPKNPCDVA